MAAFSGQVVDACLSVRSDVRDMLVCLVSGIRRRELEQADNPDEDAAMAEVIDKRSPFRKKIGHVTSVSVNYNMILSLALARRGRYQILITRKL